jgi:hypothetical protein
VGQATPGPVACAPYHRDAPFCALRLHAVAQRAAVGRIVNARLHHGRIHASHGEHPSTVELLIHVYRAIDVSDVGQPGVLKCLRYLLA